MRSLVHDCPGCEDVKKGDIFLLVTTVEMREQQYGPPMAVMHAESRRFHMTPDQFDRFVNWVDDQAATQEPPRG